MLTRIAPIGTHRVFLPIRNLQQRNLARVIGVRNYGYVHSPAEILQQSRFIVGEIDSIPANLFPMIATVPSDTPRLTVAPLRPDVYLVEISSRIAFKDPSGWYLQANLMRAKGHNAEIVSFRNASLKNYMTQIANLLGADRVCFVTHINAAAADGKPLPARSSLIEGITEVSQSLGVPVINPTELLASHSQGDILDKDGEDLNHYREDATTIVADFYFRKLRDLGWIKSEAA